MRFASYNLLAAVPGCWDSSRQQQVVDLIRDIDPDVIAAQELTGSPERAGHLAHDLAARTGLACLVRYDERRRPVQAVAAGDNTLHAALLRRPTQRGETAPTSARPTGSIVSSPERAAALPSAAGPPAMTTNAASTTAST
ncbi:endonuclease/exonuclease/phosphatase family protein [Micromonospora aurantiaca (nom. illeg.)]|uniref:endonuclease/exonuclease/phosphatase family protein n=1 Tax=Micromonospora aurantiaca (nom. illeg.) TaxID=47850 RepID=UPI0033C4B713